MNEDLIKILTQNGLGAAANSSGITTVNSKEEAPKSGSNSVIDALAKRLTEQGKGISSSSSSNLQSEIDKAMKDISRAGTLTNRALQSEREREISFARDRAGATYTTALEGRTGYATQVAGLRELTETTEKSVRDLDKRYQEAIMASDANTATQLSNLRIQKLEFQQQQEQAFYSNLLAVGNLQEQALSRQQQSEQFWIKKQQEDTQFVAGLAQSSYQFEKNYGLSLQDMGIKEQQLEIERSRYNLSLREYNDKKKELAAEKERTQLQAIVSNKIRTNLVGPDGKLVPKERLLTPNFMLEMKEQTNFDGTTEELASIINGAYNDMISDKEFMSSVQPVSGATTKKMNTGLIPRYGRSVAGGADIVSTFLGDIFWSGK